jgi:hypothetical protein
MLLERTLYADPITKEIDYAYRKASSFIYLLTAPEKFSEANQSRIMYSFIIPRDYLEGVDSVENLGLGLYTNGATESDLENFAAFCDLNLNRNAIAGAALAVDWELIISNTSNDA